MLSQLSYASFRSADISSPGLLRTDGILRETQSLFRAFPADG